MIIFCALIEQTVLENLKHDASKFLYLFKINSMKANPEKFQFRMLSKKSCQPQKLSVNTFKLQVFFFFVNLRCESFFIPFHFLHLIIFNVSFCNTYISFVLTRKLHLSLLAFNWLSKKHWNRIVESFSNNLGTAYVTVSTKHLTKVDECSISSKKSRPGLAKTIFSI